MPPSRDRGECGGVEADAACQPGVVGVSPLLVGEWVAIWAVITGSKAPGKHRLIEALERVRCECPPLPKEATDGT